MIVSESLVASTNMSAWKLTEHLSISMCKNLVVILWWFNYVKNSFIVLIPDLFKNSSRENDKTGEQNFWQSFVVWDFKKINFSKYYQARVLFKRQKITAKRLLLFGQKWLHLCFPFPFKNQMPRNGHRTGTLRGSNYLPTATTKLFLKAQLLTLSNSL